VACYLCEEETGGLQFNVSSSTLILNKFIFNGENFASWLTWSKIPAVWLSAFHNQGILSSKSISISNSKTEFKMLF